MDLGGFGAVVFPHDPRAGAVRFQSENRVQLVGGIFDVHPPVAVRAIGNPVQAMESHHMFDAQQASVFQMVPDARDRVRMTLPPRDFGVERGKAPVLPGCEERIGRRAPGHAFGEQIAVPPCVVAFGVQAEREVCSPVPADCTLLSSYTKIGESGGATSREAVDVLLPPAGSYAVYIHAFETDNVAGESGAIYTLLAWQLGLVDDAGNMTATGPGMVSAGTTEDVTVSWSGLPAGTIYLGGISHNTPDELVGLTVISVEH
jgi:hypothetical protein